MAKKHKKSNRAGCFFIFFVFFIICAVAGYLNHSGYDSTLKLTHPLRYEEQVTKFAEMYSLDKSLVFAIIKTESNFSSDAESHKGARGLMQLTESTSEWVSGKLGLNSQTISITDPETNILMGCYYFRYLLDYYNGNEHLALCAYNGGMGNVDKWLSDSAYSSDGENLDEIPFKETREYVVKIDKAKKIYERVYDM